MPPLIPNPRLGVFWIIGSKIVSFTIPVEQVLAEGGYKDYPGSHDALWLQVQRAVPKLAGRVYESVPRGRVTYSVKEETYRLLLPTAQAGKPQLVRRLIRRFGLADVRVVVLADEHYDPPPDNEEPVE